MITTIATAPIRESVARPRIELGDRATPEEDALKFNDKFVIIEGKFDISNQGHLSWWLGAIVDITRYELW